MNFSIAIHKDAESDYGVTAPDLPGCFSAGTTLDDAMVMAKEAIELHLEGMLEDGEPIPDSRPIEVHRKNRDFAGAIWAIVDVDLSKLPLKSERINITMPKRILDAVDRFAEAHGETRSGPLLKAATNYIAASNKATQTPPAKGELITCQVIILSSPCDAPVIEPFQLPPR